MLSVGPLLRKYREPPTRPPSLHHLSSASGIPEPLHDDLSSSAPSLPGSHR